MLIQRSVSRFFFPAEEIRPPLSAHFRAPRTAYGQTERGLHASLELIGPSSPTLLPKLEAAPDGGEHLQVFRWSLGFEGTKDFDWPRYLAKRESLIVQLLFELPESGISLSEVSGTLEYLKPTRPLPHSWFLRWTLRVLDKLPEITDLVAPPALAKAVAATASLIPTRDSSNRLLWYMRRFYMVDRGAYGVEWRMTRRLVEEIGSRWTGTLVVAFLRTKDDAPESSGTGPRKARVLGMVGLKPSRTGTFRDWLPFVRRRRWLDFRWRPIGHDERHLISDEMLSIDRPGPQLRLSFKGMP